MIAPLAPRSVPPTPWASFRDLRAAQVPAHPAVSAGVASADVQRGVQAAFAIMGAALANQTRQRQDAAAAELASWLRGVGFSGGWASVTPELVLAFIAAWWLPRHPARAASDQAAGPAAVKSVLSLLSGFFTRLGLGSSYDGLTGTGNPCSSVFVADFRKGYQRLAVAQGYRERSAVPLAPEKYQRLCDYLARSALAAAGAEALLLLRDLCLVLFLWETATRGHDAGRLGLGDFLPSTAPTPAAGPLAPWAWAAAGGYALLLSQRGTKTYRLQRAPTVVLGPLPGAPHRSFVRTLAYYLERCRAGGVGVQDLLFRPWKSGTFAEEPLSSAAIGVRLRRHLVTAGLFGGETVHSFRRGALQAAEARGAGLAELHALGQIRSPAVLQRYLDPARHLVAGEPLL